MIRHLPGLVNDPTGCNGRISLDLNDHVIWNKDEFIKFLVAHQGLVIDVEIPEGACLKSAGVYDLLDLFNFKAVTLRTHNLIESAPAPYMLDIHKLASFQYFNIDSVDYTSFHCWSEKKVFGALYNRPTWSRLGITGHLLTHHADKTLLNFRVDPHHDDNRRHFEIQALYQNAPDSVKDFMNISHTLPLRLEEYDGYTMSGTTQAHTDQLSAFYTDFLIDIVSETFVRGRSFYPTEKTTRPMLMKKPFIHMGSKCFLIHLRQMGFRTFNDFWDEDYDGHYPHDRYTKILKLIDNLANKSITELRGMYEDMRPILDHNYKLLIEKNYRKKITYVD
jgi:hypothetical protein